MKVSDMHYHHWEAVLMEYNVYKDAGVFDTEFIDEVDSINKAIKETGRFNEDLKRRATFVANIVAKQDKAIFELYQKAQEDLLHKA